MSTFFKELVVQFPWRGNGFPILVDIRVQHPSAAALGQTPGRCRDGDDHDNHENMHGRQIHDR